MVYDLCQSGGGGGKPLLTAVRRRRGAAVMRLGRCDWAEGQGQECQGQFLFLQFPNGVMGKTECRERTMSVARAWLQVFASNKLTLAGISSCLELMTACLCGHCKISVNV